MVVNKSVNKAAKIFVAGHRGLIGSSLCRQLKELGYTNVLTATRAELDLADQTQVYDFIAKHKPDTVLVAAAKVGGILANSTYRVEFIAENLQIQNNLILGAHRANVPRLVFLGSSCIYPRMAPQPMPEGALLTGELEFTNRPYALAKIAGLELVASLRTQYGRNYFSVMPTNLYGPGDNFHPENSHVLPGLMRRFWEAKRKNLPEVAIWGSGAAFREFLYVDDCAEGIIFLMENFEEKELKERGLTQKGMYHVNLGSGMEVTIRDLAQLIKKCVGYDGAIRFDTTKPDGTPRKLVDSSLLNAMGWKAHTDLTTGIRKTFDWLQTEFAAHPDSLRL